MKIIIRDEQGLMRCFAQVRDAKYLAQRYDSKKFLNLALGNAAYRNLKDDDFYEVKNRAVAQIILENPYIVDFSEMVKCDGLTLNRIILLSQSPISYGKQKMDEQHKVEDLLDILNFNRGMLTYPIPVYYDGNIMMDNGEVVFGSTTIPGFYMLRSYNEELDLNEYLELNSGSLYERVNPEGEMVSYEVTKVNNGLLVHFKEKNKILSQIRKRLSK